VVCPMRPYKRAAHNRFTVGMLRPLSRPERARTVRLTALRLHRRGSLGLHFHPLPRHLPRSKTHIKQHFPKVSICIFRTFQNLTESTGISAVGGWRESARRTESFEAVDARSISAALCRKSDEGGSQHFIRRAVYYCIVRISHRIKLLRFVTLPRTCKRIASARSSSTARCARFHSSCCRRACSPGWVFSRATQTLWWC
jgi:hypothetical protein